MPFSIDPNIWYSLTRLSHEAVMATDPTSHCQSSLRPVSAWQEVVSYTKSRALM